ncbi:MAG: glycosyltransferase family 4 protein [Chthoniobacteraceae bacterium]
MQETKKRLGYIKGGLFSYTNVRVREQLAEQFPSLELDVIDVWTDLIDAQRGAYPLALAQAAWRYPRHLLKHRNAPKNIALRTPYLFRTLRRLVGQRLAGHAGDYRFTFQTQSIFDASTPGVPHFVFTDHTHLANLRYPAFRRSDLFPSPWTGLEREIYGHARHIFVMSDHVRDSLCEDYGVEPARVTTVHGGSNVDPSSMPLDNDGYRNRTVVFVGIDWERKGGPALAAAFERLREHVPDARLIVIGCRPDLGKPWCEELGKLPREEVKRHLVRGSVFCLPTRIEPFGIAVIEAFNHRLPSVVSNVGAMPSMVRHGESGLIVPPDDPATLADALRELLLDPEKCRRFGEAGFRDSGERYTWASAGRKIRDGIERSLATGG